MMELGVFAVVMVVMVLGIYANQAAYRNGFWDGVLWERDRDGRIYGDYPDGPHEKCPNDICVACDMYPPGGESKYPSKPDCSWPRWASLAAGAKQRVEAKKVWNDDD